MTGGVVRAFGWLLVTLSLAAALVGLERTRTPTAAWTVAGWWLPSVAASDEPLVAFVDAACPACVAGRVQLRVCPIAGGGACDVAARVVPAQDGVTRVRYPRTLAPGAYRVELLFVAEDRWGAMRTLERRAATVEVR